MKKTRSLIYLLLIYLGTCGVMLLVFVFSHDENLFTIVLAADITWTILIFTGSYYLKNSSLYDPYWSVAPPVIFLYLILQNPEGHPIRQWIVFSLILFWSIRLTTNWARSWQGFNHEDWRYKKIAEQTGRFYWLASLFGIHLFPTLMVYLGCLPLFYLAESQQTFSLFEIIPALLTLAAILFEWISDEQLKKFRKNSSGTEILKSGLWGWVRHPNYLGEILFWSGLFLFIPFRSLTQGFWTIIGPLGMILLFKYISIPMMDKRNLERRPGYREHMENIPSLFPGKNNKTTIS